MVCVFGCFECVFEYYFVLRVWVFCFFGFYVEEGGVELVDVVWEEVGVVDFEVVGFVEVGGVEGLLVEVGGGYGVLGGFGLGEVVV